MASGYTHIKKVLFDIYGLYLIDENAVYKGHRYKKFNTYRVVDENNTIILEHVPLKVLADFLRENGDY